MERKRKDLTKYIETLGVSEFGYATLHKTERYPYQEILTYAVSVVVKLSDFTIDEIVDRPTFSYFHHYRTVNSFIDRTLLKIGMKIETMGYRYQPVPASQSIRGGNYEGLFQHKTVARLAGLGSIGKSGLFLSNRYGSRVRLGTILTDLPLCDINRVVEYNNCSGCDRCVSACPAMAISGAAWEEGNDREIILDAHACSEYMKEHFQHIGRGSVCGICMKVCNAAQVRED